MRQEGKMDPFLPDQINGITYQGNILHGTPRDTIMITSHGQDLQTYICEKSNWILDILNSLDLDGVPQVYEHSR